MNTYPILALAMQACSSLERPVSGRHFGILTDWKWPAADVGKQVGYLEVRSRDGLWRWDRLPYRSICNCAYSVRRPDM
jgi:hypothetical protein